MGNEASIKKNIIYSEKYVFEPLGDTPNLCGDERAYWEEWKSRVPKLAAEYPDKLYMNGSTVKKTVCLTFDDAPDIKYTSGILDVLKKYKVKASFFIVGMRVEKLPGLTRRIHEEGHLILNHTWQHYDLTTISPEVLSEEIVSTEEKIYEVTGKRPALMRPPYGAVDKTVVGLTDRLGYRVVLWSVNTFDWLEKTKDNIVKNVLDNVRPGDIFLLHSYENKRPTLEALPIIIEELRARGYEFENLAEILDIEPYKI